MTPSAWGDRPELLEVFRSEAAERLESLNTGLLDLESNPGSTQALERICRDAHSVKGSARLLGFAEVADLAHEMEEVLVVLRDGLRRITPAVCDLLLDACDALSVLAGVAPPTDEDRDPPDPATTVQRLRAAFDGESTGLADSAGAAANAAVGEVAAAAAPPVDRPAATPQVTSAQPVRPPPAQVSDTEIAVWSATVDGGSDSGDSGGGGGGDRGDRGGQSRPERSPAARPDPPARTAAPPAGEPAKPAAARSVVRLETAKVYSLIDAVGEALIGQNAMQDRSIRLAEMARRMDIVLRRHAPDRLGAGTVNRANRSHAPGVRETQLAAVLDGFHDELAAIAHDVQDLVDESSKRMEFLQERAMALAMFPTRTIFGPLPRLVRDLCRELGKEAELVVVDDGAELDKQVLERIAEPIRALIINALDHGIEPPAERAAAGKPRHATIRLTASQHGGQVLIEVVDDGRGIDVERVRRRAVEQGLLSTDEDLDEAGLASVLFQPGFSTVDTASHLSGRGVGLDILRSAIDSLQGGIQVHTAAGEGTRFVLSLPTTLAIVDVVLVEVAGRQFALPVSAVHEVVSAADVTVDRVGGRRAIDLRGDVLTHREMADLLGIEASGPAAAPEAGRSAAAGPIVILGHAGRSAALQVQACRGQQEVVVKSLGTFLPKMRHIAGASILGSGEIVLVLDPASLLDAARRDAGPLRGGRAHKQQPPRRRLLVVDDAFPIREMQRSILEGAGFDVVTAADGVEALEVLAATTVDGVVTDVEMPEMGGLELCQQVRATHPTLPVVMVTSLSSEADRRRGLEVGANAYLAKSDFDQGRLVDILQSLV